MTDEKNIILNLSDLIADNYQNNPTMRLLLPVVAAITGAATGDVMTGAIAAGAIVSLGEGLDFAVTKIHQERFNTLVDELDKQNIILTEQVAQSEEFIHSVLVITRASLNTYQREKIRRFARILISGIERDKLASDEFEEFVRILQSLTIRELEILQLLQSYQKDNPHKIVEQKDHKNNIIREYLEDDLQRAKHFWDEFLEEASIKFNIEQTNVSSILTGLNRTGMYETFSGGFIGYTGGIGKTTKIFEEFSEWVRFEVDTDTILYPDD